MGNRSMVFYRIFFTIFIASILTCLGVYSDACAQYLSENLFYLVDSEDSFQSFNDHIDQISIVAPQTYSISEAGVVWGEVDPRVLDLANRNDVKVMPLIVNPGFDRDLFHNFLHDSAAQKRTIAMMVGLAEEHNFYGWQFDFENIHISDRAAFTEFYKRTAEQLHARGFALSVAVVPTNSDSRLPTEYHRFLYEYWRGVFDYKALAEIGDFLSVMTYSQHTRRTPPGPVAGIPWMEEMVTYLLDLGITPDKISIGIPFYSNYWFADYSDEKGGFVNGSGASYEKVKGLIDRYNADIVWLDTQKCNYALWNHDGVFEYAFVEDSKSLDAKLDLLGKYKLRGISVWRLGQEDPAVWDVIKKDTQANSR